MTGTTVETAPESRQQLRNRFDRMEWAGAFGDLGTLIPFVAVYIAVLRLDPLGILFAFGASMVVCGLYYKTPFPVQPMKAIGAVAAMQAVQSALVTPGAVYSAALVTGTFWLFLGLTGLTSRIAKLVPQIVVTGIVLGLGFGFMLEGIKMMQTNWLVATIGAAGTLLLMGSRTIPAMFVLLLFGAAVGACQHPELLTQIANTPFGFHAPKLALTEISWSSFWVGVGLLALPQLPLTLGNAILAIKEENNRLFPNHPVTESEVAVSTGIMNLFSGTLGGIPMCHGAGGMAAHVAFGARTGGSVVIGGSVLLIIALMFSGSVEVLFQLFPAAVLGVILFSTGVQLALGGSQLPSARGGRVVVLVTAALCMYNVAVGFLVGIALNNLNERHHLKF
jgi:MFS superfamily sulfate permease-like transporter